jgi:hypothetical protein
MTHDGRQRSAETLAALLRVEIAAVEAYTLALAKLDGDPRGERLRGLRDGHLDAANLLRRHVVDRGQGIAAGSAAWATFARAVDRPAEADADVSLRVLKEGEERGVLGYESVIRRDEVEDEVRDLILRTILPRQRAHVTEVERLLSTR